MEKIKVNKTLKELESSDLGYGSIPYSDFIRKVTLTDKDQGVFEDITVDISYSDDHLSLVFSGVRLETDEELDVRVRAHKKYQDRKRNIKLSQKEKELKTIKTLMKKNNLSTISIDY